MDSKHPRLRLGAIALLVSGLLGCQQDSSEPPPGNTLYLNGKIHTQDGQRSQAEAMVTMLAVAAGDMPEETFAAWLRTHSVARA